MQAEWYDDYVVRLQGRPLIVRAHLPIEARCRTGSSRSGLLRRRRRPDQGQAAGDEEPEVGFFDAGDDECNSHVWGTSPTRFSGDGSPPELQRTGPIPLTLAGSGHLDHEGNGDPASIDYDWDYELTIQRVDENGDPIG